MNRADRRAAKPGGRKPAPGKMAWEDRWTLIICGMLAGGAILLQAATAVTPLVTGRCLKCVVTGNQDCRWQTRHSHGR